MLNGQGTMEYNNGIRYSGTFADNTMHGEGTVVWPDGSTYCGTFECDRRCGYGEHTVNENHQPNEFRPIQGIICDTVFCGVCADIRLTHCALILINASSRVPNQYSLTFSLFYRYCWFM